MKKLHLALLGALLVLGLYSCVEERFLGPVEEESFTLAAFTELEAETLGKIYLVPSDEYRVTVRSHRDVLADVDVRVSQGRLVLEYDPPRLISRDIDVFEYTVYMPFLNHITLKDVADIIGREGFSTDQLALRLEDVGNITLRDIAVDEIDARVNGVGDIDITGSADIAYYTLQDVGNIKAFGMITRECTATVKGVGDIQLYAVEQLDATIKGVGDIEYKGNPAVSVHIDGQGKVRNRN